MPPPLPNPPFPEVILEDESDNEVQIITPTALPIIPTTALSATPPTLAQIGQAKSSRISRTILAGIPKDKYASGGDGYEHQMRFDIVISALSLEILPGWGSDEQQDLTLRGEPLKIASKVMELVEKVRVGGIITTEEEKWINSKKGYVYSKLINDLNKTRLSIYTGGDEDMIELCNAPQQGPGLCQYCLIKHESTYDELLCVDRTKFGPRKVNWWNKTPEIWVDIEAVVVGLEGFIYLPPQLGKMALNLGLQRKADYATGISFNYPVLTYEGSLALELYKRLAFIGLQSSLPIFIEFYTDESGKDKDWKSNLFGFIRVILNLQSHYSGKLILSLPPAKPVENDNPTTYTKAKQKRTKLSHYARILGHMSGVPVWVPQVQTFRNGKDPKFYSSPMWANEFLFGPNRDICKEFTWRVGSEWYAVIKKLNQYAIPTQF